MKPVGRETNNILAEHLCAHIEGEFVVFLIGFRINRLWAIHRWLPMMTTMI